ncbi:hypothetical protein L6R50_01555 [Myxococcota bacterium]|nr:hypothetical protein [Myxococcota bacterium]
MKLSLNPYVMLSALLGLGLLGTACQVSGDDDDDDAADDDAADDDTADDDTMADDDTADDDTFVPSYDEPNSWTYRMFVWPEYSSGTLAGYAGEFTLSYYETDFGGGGSPVPICDDLFTFKATWTPTVDGSECPGCQGALSNYVFTDVPLSDEETLADWDTCEFENPEDWVTADVLATTDFQDILSVAVGTEFDTAYTIIDVQGLIDQLLGYGLDPSHQGYKPDVIDGDGDGDVTEIIPWGIYYGNPGEWNDDFTTNEMVEVDGVPTMVYGYYFWWIFGI